MLSVLSPSVEQDDIGPEQDSVILSREGCWDIWSYWWTGEGQGCYWSDARGSVSRRYLWSFLHTCNQSSNGETWDPAEYLSFLLVAGITREQCSAEHTNNDIILHYHWDYVGFWNRYCINTQYAEKAFLLAHSPHRCFQKGEGSIIIEAYSKYCVFTAVSMSRCMNSTELITRPPPAAEGRPWRGPCAWRPPARGRTAPPPASTRPAPGSSPPTPAGPAPQPADLRSRASNEGSRRFHNRALTWLKVSTSAFTFNLNFKTLC